MSIEAAEGRAAGATGGGRNLVLVGLMGAGKTTVGRLLARRLARPFVDTDALVEAEAGRRVADIFAAEGEEAFRRRERAAVRAAAAQTGQVVAVGGGAVCDSANVAALRATGVLVFLDAEPSVLAGRVAAGVARGTRPLLADAADAEARLAALHAERAAAYEAARDVVFGTGGRNPREVADAVVAWARARGGVLTDGERAR